MLQYRRMSANRTPFENPHISARDLMPGPWTNAIVVGASSGIGAELSRQLAAMGCRVAMVARRDAELARIAGEINSLPTAIPPRYDGLTPASPGAAESSGAVAVAEPPAAISREIALAYSHDVTNY